MTEVDDRGMQYTKPTHGQSLLEKIWDALDAYLDALQTTPDDGEGNLKLIAGSCKALAWVLHTSMESWYPTVESVTIEAVKRREIRLGEREWSPTPGYQYNPIPKDHPAYQKLNAQSASEPTAARKAAATVRKRAAASYKMKPGDEEAIKNGLAMGVDAEELAGMLKIPVDIVKSFA